MYTKEFEMAKGKPGDEKIKDAKKLKDEMAEGKNPGVTAQIYRKGDKYYCAECNSELPIHQSCPTCHAHIDWDRVLMENRR
jgi:hypothetical protein